MLGVFAHDGIALPVTDAGAFVDACWALADVAFPMQDAARGPAAIAFSAGFGHDSGEAEEVASLTFVASDSAVDGLVARNRFAFVEELTDDLLGAPTESEGLVDFLENRFLEAGSTATPTASGGGVAVSLLYAVDTVTCRSVAAELAGDGAGSAIEDERDGADALAKPLVVRNEISLVLGELAISHGCNPFLPDEVETSIASHPPQNQGVALSM